MTWGDEGYPEALRAGGGAAEPGLHNEPPKPH